jgi:hypothetical protein
MSALRNKILVNLLQMLHRYFFAKAFAANLMILTKNAVQIAAAEKKTVPNHACR